MFAVLLPGVGPEGLELAPWLYAAALFVLGKVVDMAAPDLWARAKGYFRRRREKRNPRRRIGFGPK